MEQTTNKRYQVQALHTCDFEWTPTEHSFDDEADAVAKVSELKNNSAVNKYRYVDSTEDLD
ncbi:MAG: hypothetical protein KC517_09315 [Bacteroidetes bacterium]|nr:hypothetical protein [Bacteroidota bacterium]